MFHWMLHELDIPLVLAHVMRAWIVGACGLVIGASIRSMLGVPHKQQARFLGLALLCFAVLAGSFNKYSQPATVSTALTTVAMAILVYGVVAWRKQ